MLRGGIGIIVQHHPTAIPFPKRWRCRVVSQCDDITVGQKLLEPDGEVRTCHNQKSVSKWRWLAKTNGDLADF